VPALSAASDDRSRPLDELDDDLLLVLARQGDEDAYAVLYERHEYGARRLARHLGQREETDDVVADSFERIWSLLKRGKGPERSFRAYLFTAVRHESGRRAKQTQRVRPTDDETLIDTSVPFGDGRMDGFEAEAVRAAYESLSPRWRQVLWHIDVEGRQPGELAAAMDMHPNSVSALVYRARSGLRDAYLQQHVRTTEPLAAACAEVRSKLASIVRRTASVRDQEKTHAHLSSCDDCMRVYLELGEDGLQVG
jgi:RNA polymerase sigma factor (sigma-70 family)